MSEREPYSEWYWTWVDHPVMTPFRWAWTALRPIADEPLFWLALITWGWVGCG